MPDNLAGADHLVVLVLGGGPAALCISSELNQRGVAVGCIAPDPVDAPWPNTYGIWSDELKAVGLEQLLEHRWSDTVSYFGEGGSTLRIRAMPTGSTTACSIGRLCSAIGWSGLRVWSFIKTPLSGWT